MDLVTGKAVFVVSIGNRRASVVGRNCWHVAGASSGVVNIIQRLPLHSDNSCGGNESLEVI